MWVHTNYYLMSTSKKKSGPGINSGLSSLDLLNPKLLKPNVPASPTNTARARLLNTAASTLAEPVVLTPQNLRSGNHYLCLLCAEQVTAHPLPFADPATGIAIFNSERIVAGTVPAALCDFIPANSNNDHLVEFNIGIAPGLNASHPGVTFNSVVSDSASKKEVLSSITIKQSQVITLKVPKSGITANTMRAGLIQMNKPGFFAQWLLHSVKIISVK